MPMEAMRLIARKNNEYLLRPISIFDISMMHGMYGIHFCDSDSLRDLRRIGFHVSVLDFSHAASNTKAMDDLYLQVCWIYSRNVDT